MRYIFLTLIASIIFLTVNGQKRQKDNYRTQIDTLGFQGDTVLARIKYFTNGDITDDFDAILLRPFYIKMPRHTILGRTFFLKRALVAKAINNGEAIIYGPFERKEIAEYRYGEKIKSKYFDENSKEITESEYRSGTSRNLICSRPEDLPYYLIFLGSKK